MLRINNSKLMLTSQGYHFDEHGKKFVRVFTSLNFIKIQVCSFNCQSLLSM